MAVVNVACVYALLGEADKAVDCLEKSITHGWGQRKWMEHEVNFSIVPGEKFNSFRGPTFKDVDFSVSRVFHLGERYQLGFRAEAFDLFNHPNYQQNVVDNVQYTICPDPNVQCPVTNPNNSTDQLWTAGPNTDFGAPGAIVPKFGSRSFQFSTRFTF